MIAAREALELLPKLAPFVGAEYALETGAVDFFDGVPEAGQICDRQFEPMTEPLE